MATPEDANLILKLYELRREEKMREARDWFVTKFHPASVQDIVAALGGEDSAKLRMVGSYWDMAAALVNHGTIDPELFNEANGEHFIVYAKMQPFIEDMRKHFDNPRLFSGLEKLVKDAPYGEETVARWQARWKAQAESRQAAAN